ISFLSGMTQEDAVHQLPSIHLTENEKRILFCQYETSGSPNLFWYIQEHNKAPELLLNEYLNDNPRFKECFSASHDKSKKTFNLTLSAAVLSDSATYFCAVRPTLCQSVSHLYKNFML
ncbi:TVA3 protein, partial [Polyodon spathula]|nr:TVA3 protein [Polyodon spathula]